MLNEIFIKVKDDSVSYEEIQGLLNLAHKQNAEHGLVYATFNQSIEKLVAKIGNGVCFVALIEIDSRNGFRLVGTCTLEERELKYWYVNGEKILLLKLVGGSS